MDESSQKQDLRVVGRIKNFWRMNSRDMRKFGPLIALRHLLPRDNLGAVTIPTRLGRLSLRPTDSDLEVFRHVFADKAYNLEWIPQNARIMARHDEIVSRGRKPIIIDAGANVGASPLWFARKYPQAKIIAVEPDPSNAEIARRNCTLSNIQVVEAAIGSSPGKVHLAQSYPKSFAVKVVRDERADVPVVTIADLMTAQGEACELLMVKLDIEGFERDLFAENVEWIDDAQAIIIEPHDWLFPGEFSSLTMQKALFQRRFEVVLHGENLIFVR